jgi:anti-anti-sigma factor
MEMTTTELNTDVTCVRLNGRLDSTAAERIETPLTAAVVARGRPAVIDLSGVTFVASMGIRVLIATARGLKLKGSPLVLFGAQGLVEEVLDQAALGQLIPIVETQPQALERLRA